jgi:hypothetical protein
VQVRSGGVWTGWFNTGVWVSGTENVKRHSADGKKVGDWQVLTDILQSIGPVFVDVYRYRLTLFTEEWGISPSVRRVCVADSVSTRHGECLGTPGDENL